MNNYSYNKDNKKPAKYTGNISRRNLLKASIPLGLGVAALAYIGNQSGDIDKILVRKDGDEISAKFRGHHFRLVSHNGTEGLNSILHKLNYELNHENHPDFKIKGNRLEDLTRLFTSLDGKAISSLKYGEEIKIQYQFKPVPNLNPDRKYYFPVYLPMP